METADPSTPIWLPFAIMGAFAIVFPVFWCGVVGLISVIGGWRSLAGHYRAGDLPVTGVQADSVNGSVGLANYRYTLTLHFNEDGFFIETMVLFRFGHPRLFIPWSEVVKRKRVRWGFYTLDKLWIGNPTVATVSLPAEVMDRHAPGS